MKLIIFVIAGVAGVFVVKAFFFDNIEQIAWNIFWNNFGNANFDYSNERIFNSATFIKSLSGFCISGFAGLSIYNYNKRSKKK